MANQIHEQGGEICCESCRRKVFQSLSNRCMYCGNELPESFYLEGSEKDAFIQQQAAQLEESAAFAKGMSTLSVLEEEKKRKLSEKKKKKKRLLGVGAIRILNPLN